MKDRLRNIDIRDWAEKAKDRAVRAGLAMAVVGSMGLAGCQQSPEQRAAEVAAAVQTVLAEGTPTPDTILALTTQVGENPKVSEASGVIGETAKHPLEEAHAARVRELAKIYQEQGLDVWLKAAGYSWEELRLRSPQIVEEILGQTIYPSGLIVEVRGLNVNYPAGMTTDQPVDGRCYQPDPDNPSRVCTDVKGFNGPATLWVDLSNWGQLTPTEESISSQGETARRETSCPKSLTDLSGFGPIEQELEHPAGQLAGAVVGDLSEQEISLLESCGYTVQGTNPTIRSLWSPEEMRPLPRR